MAIRTMAAAAALTLICATGDGAAAAAGARQAAYDAAQAAYDREDWRAAAQGFASLLPANPAKPLGASESVIAVRLADARFKLGQDEGTAALARHGLIGVPDGDAGTLSLGWRILGDQARFAQDAEGARLAYGKAIGYAARSGVWRDRVLAVAGNAMALTTVDPVAAADPLDVLLGDAKSASAVSKPTLANLEELRARAALNAGDLPAAQRWVDRALEHSGGLGASSVSLLQVAIRGDVALVAQRRGDDEAVRRYLAFTGAGHLASTDWVGKFDGDLPVCGADGDVRAQDHAVVQIAIGPDGRVLGAVPVYASRAGDIGGIFARAVMGWRWSPDAIGKVEPFWRSSLRLELRCETRPNPERLGKPIYAAAAAWLRGRGVALPDSGPDDKAVPVTAAADEASLARDDLAAVPALLRRMTGTRKDRDQSASRLAAILDAADAPAELRAVVLSVTANRLGGSDTHAKAVRARAAILSRAVPGFVMRYPGSLASSWLRLEWAIAIEESGDFVAAGPVIEQVLATPEAVLPADDPIRQVAALHLAIVRRRSGDAAGADAAIRQAGLDAAQCSLVDTRPVPTNLRIVSMQFPAEALRWRFEGYVRVAYDIGADGRPQAIRSIVSYPPYVFDEGTERAAGSFRYAAPTIDGQPVGCTGETQSVQYQIPRS